MNWIRNTFSDDISLEHVQISEKEEATQLKADRNLIESKTELAHYRLYLASEYTYFSKRAIYTKLLPFATKYLCELAFLKLSTIKSKKEIV